MIGSPRMQCSTQKILAMEMVSPQAKGAVESLVSIYPCSLSHWLGTATGKCDHGTDVVVSVKLLELGSVISTC